MAIWLRQLRSLPRAIMAGPRFGMGWLCPAQPNACGATTNRSWLRVAWRSRAVASLWRGSAVPWTSRARLRRSCIGADLQTQDKHGRATPWTSTVPFGNAPFGYNNSQQNINFAFSSTGASGEEIRNSIPGFCVGFSIEFRFPEGELETELGTQPNACGAHH